MGKVEVTNVRIKKYNNEMRAKAIASVVINDSVCINDIKIIEGKEGLFMAMPSRKTASNEFKDIAHPINSETREIIQTAILQAYENEIKE
ncbi:MAG: septation regulator SpoVG [Clostridia bacterium]|nr:septation regulator SpoVG [Clostridia bacterium]